MGELPLDGPKFPVQPVPSKKSLQLVCSAPTAMFTCCVGGTSAPLGPFISSKTSMKPFRTGPLVASSRSAVPKAAAVEKLTVVFGGFGPAMVAAFALNEAPAEVEGEPKLGPLTLPEMLALACQIGASITAHDEEVDVDNTIGPVALARQAVPVMIPAWTAPAESRHRKEAQSVNRMFHLK